MLLAGAIPGGNRSGDIALRREQVLIETGPYRPVRRPIHLGLVVAFLGGGGASGEWRG
ncbi:MAG: hypothetical protein ACREFO_03895 [Acetobacteraceae bacterium]